MPNKHPVMCPICAYKWSTRVKDLSKVVCPKCQFVGCFSDSHSAKSSTETQADVGCFLAPATTPPKIYLRSRREYGKTAVDDYVKYLGCWDSENFDRAVNQRTPQEYRAKLIKLIVVNTTRNDEIGTMETAAANAVLKRLG